MSSLLLMAAAAARRHRGGGIAYATWSPTDKGTGIVLSGGNLSASVSSATLYNSVRANIALSGKRYWEISTSWHSGGSVAGMGIATSAMALTSATVYTGSQSTNCGLWGPDDGVYKSNAVILADPGQPSGAAIYKFAFDAATRKLWIGDTVLGWYNAGNPAAGTGQVTTMAAGTYFPALTIANTSADTFTANFGASAFTGTVPSGFTGGVS